MTQDLKKSRQVADLVLTDNLFQTVGAAMEKDRESSEVEVNGWCTRWVEDDRSVLAASGICVEGHWGILACQTALPWRYESNCQSTVDNISSLHQHLDGKITVYYVGDNYALELAAMTNVNYLHKDCLKYLECLQVSYALTWTQAHNLQHDRTLV